MHLAEIGDLRDPPDLGGGELDNGRVDRRHGVVDPHVDPAEGGNEAVRRLLHVVVIGDIGLQHERPPARALDLPGGTLQAIPPARQEADGPARLAESRRHGAPDSRGGARHHDHARSVPVHPSPVSRSVA